MKVTKQTTNRNEFSGGVITRRCFYFLFSFFLFQRISKTKLYSFELMRLKDLR